MPTDSWVFRVVPVLAESQGHFLGRFRRANELRHKGNAEQLGVGDEWVRAWESAWLRRNPTDLQQLALCKLVEVKCEQLTTMLPPQELHLQTRLCAACYGEAPVPRVSWQQKGIDWSERHKIRMRSTCPICATGFRTPALWNNEPCQGCGLTFEQMESSDRRDDVERS